MSTLIILLLILPSNDIELNSDPVVNNELSIFHLNIRSVRHKIDCKESVSNEADIICLTETYLDQNVSNYDIFIEGRNNSGEGLLYIHAIPRQD